MMNLDIVGVVVLIIVIIAITTFKRRNVRNPQLEVFEHGTIVMARVTAIEERTETIRMNPRFPIESRRFIVRSEWTDPRTQQTYTFLSNPLLAVPEHIHVDGTVKVKIDPNDPYEYLVDISA